MRLQFRHDDGVDTQGVWTDLSLKRKPLEIIRQANASGWLYVQPRYAETLRVVGRFEDGVWKHTNDNGGQHEGFNVNAWIDYLYLNGHKL